MEEYFLCPLSLTNSTQVKGGSVSWSQLWTLLLSLLISAWWLLPYRVHASRGWAYKSETEHFISLLWFLYWLLEFKVKCSSLNELLEQKRILWSYHGLLTSSPFHREPQQSQVPLLPHPADVHLHQTKAQGKLANGHVFHCKFHWGLWHILTPLGSIILSNTADICIPKVLSLLYLSS